MGPIDHSNAWWWHQFGCGLAFTHFYLVTSDLLFNFLVAVAHSFFNILSGLTPLDKGGGSGRRNAQVGVLIWHLLVALRGIYKNPGIVDNPVHILAAIG